MTRVDSVRKEKEELLRRNYESKGIDTFFTTLNLKVNVDDYSHALHQKLIQSVKRKVQKTFNDSSYEDMIKLIEEVSFEQKKIEVHPIEPSFKDYMIRLLKGCAKLYCTEEVIENKYHPVKIIVSDGEKKKEGYTLLKTKFNKKYHKRGWQLRRSGYDYQTLYDIASLVAETLVHNALVKFAKANGDYVKYAMTRNMLTNSYSNKLKVPQSEAFRREFLRIVEDYQLVENIDEYEKIGIVDESDDSIDDTRLLEAVERDADLKLILPDKNVEQQKKSFFLEEDKNGCLDIGDYKLIGVLIPEFFRQMNYLKTKTDQEFQQRSDYARAFQTKKHINKSVLRKMKDNAFLIKYHYVEFDNDADLDKVAKLEKEFVELTEKVYIPYREDHSFRMKKLGKHRAAGLYFPTKKATIVDLDHPSSLVHEIGHQLDHCLASSSRTLLSEAIRFRVVYDAYKGSVEKKVRGLDKEHPFRKRWDGKTKYNSSYFLQNTEVFARSFELYLYYGKGIRSSFLNSYYDSPEYPVDETYLESVKKYFDSIFDFITPEETKQKQKVQEKGAASPKPLVPEQNNNVEVEAEEEGQLTFGF